MTATSASKVAQTIDFVSQRPPTPLRIAKTNITTTAAKVHYPRPPRQTGSLRYFKCPCCALVLPELYREGTAWIPPLIFPSIDGLLGHLQHLHAFSLRSLPWTSSGIGDEENEGRYMGDSYFDNADYFDQGSDNQSCMDDPNDSDQDTDGLASLLSCVISAVSQGSATGEIRSTNTSSDEETQPATSTTYHKNTPYLAEDDDTLIIEVFDEKNIEKEKKGYLGRKTIRVGDALNLLKDTSGRGFAIDARGGTS
ncbi:hypothetical protein CMUS01_12739 [Colletotrichum musicola]|uniref:Uncharacterized protein n=1 Tax=Colletotrichum musicola TaxID=2175873 RepID=A0A8H6JJA4_9PEZI|nr:hypothetical protein CMUS01_12739 [Colletotrichum musicola]